MKKMLLFNEFNKVDLRVGTIIDVADFPEAHKPAYQITIDFGALGIKKTSAQVTHLYSKSDLYEKQVIAVVNFPRKQIANFMSDCLLLGAVNGVSVILLNPETQVPNGALVS